MRRLRVLHQTREKETLAQLDHSTREVKRGISNCDFLGLNWIKIWTTHDAARQTQREAERPGPCSTGSAQEDTVDEPAPDPAWNYVLEPGRQMVLVNTMSDVQRDAPESTSTQSLADTSTTTEELEEYTTLSEASGLQLGSEQRLEVARDASRGGGQRRRRDAGASGWPLATSGRACGGSRASTSDLKPTSSTSANGDSTTAPKASTQSGTFARAACSKVSFA